MTRTVIKVAGRNLAVQRLQAPGRGRRADAGVPPRGPGLDRPLAGLSHAAVRTARPAGPRLRPLGPRPVGAVRSAPRGPLPARRGASSSCRGCSSGGRGAPVLVGHSDGGTIALLFAARFPDRAAAVVPRPHMSSSRTSPSPASVAAGRAFAETDLATRLARYHGDKTHSLFRAWHDRWLAPEFRVLEHRGRAGPVSPARCWCSRARRISTAPWAGRGDRPGSFGSLTDGAAPGDRPHAASGSCRTGPRPHGQLRASQLG